MNIWAVQSLKMKFGENGAIENKSRDNAWRDCMNSTKEVSICFKNRIQTSAKYNSSGEFKN